MCLPDSPPHADKNASCKVHHLSKQFPQNMTFPMDLSDMNNPQSAETDSWSSQMRSYSLAGKMPLEMAGEGETR